MNTTNKDAKVEYFLTKWRANKTGAFEKIRQSESFRLDGHFKVHQDRQMRLEVTDDGKHAYIVQDFDSLPFKILCWEVATLEKLADVDPEASGDRKRNSEAWSELYGSSG